MSCVVLAADSTIVFEAQELERDVVKVAYYGLATTDVDGDGRVDIIAATENQVVWWQAPDWKRRVIISDQVERDHVCLAPYDIDGDGQVDFALGAGWTKIGTIYWLSRKASLDEPWSVHAIGREIWTHRMRFADVLGTGHPQLTLSPLNAVDAPGVKLTAFSIPKSPKTDAWPRTVLDESLNALHNHWHVRLPGETHDSTLTASREGVGLVQKTANGFARTVLATGVADAKPELAGAGEVKAGRFDRDRLLFATVEPMHGHTAAVYVGGKSWTDPFQRVVLDDGYKQGHAVWVADLDGDGRDEVIAGHRERSNAASPGPGVYLYRGSEDGRTWVKQPLDDGGMAVEDMAAADLDGDGDIDLIAGGRATKNLKIYWNRTAKPAAAR